MIEPHIVRQALARNAAQEGTQWRFRGSWVVRPESEALSIVEACLLLGVRVTDTLDGEAWNKAVALIVDLERRVSRLERGERS